METRQIKQHQYQKHIIFENQTNTPKSKPKHPNPIWNFKYSNPFYR